MLNKHLNISKKNKDDEFYTRYCDIESEMSYYKDFFKGKVVYCNCDSYYNSNFFYYFNSNFCNLGLKGFLCSGFRTDGVGAYYMRYGDMHEESIIDSGSFDSAESLKWLDMCDVVITNPPFSKLRDYVDLMVNSGKYFITLIPCHSLDYKKFVEYFSTEKFYIRDTIYTVRKFENKDVNNPCLWINNIKEVEKDFKFTKDYYTTDKKDLKICDKTGYLITGGIYDIYKNYDGYMGVTQCILTKINARHFEWGEVINPSVNGKNIFSRILIKHKHLNVD